MIYSATCKSISRSTIHPAERYNDLREIGALAFCIWLTISLPVLCILAAGQNWLHESEMAVENAVVLNWRWIPRLFF